MVGVFFFFFPCAGLPCPKNQDFLSPVYTPPEQPPCMLEKLCELHDGLVLEAKGIKEHYFKPYIKKLFERQVLSHLRFSLESVSLSCISLK